MQTNRLPYQILFSAAFALAMLFSQYATATPVVLIVLPGSQLSTVAGDQVQIDIRISGLGSAKSPSLGTYDLDFSYDQTTLAFNHISWGTGLDIFGLGSLRDATFSAGLLNLFEASLDSVADLTALQPSNFLLASLVFHGLTTGSSNISLSINALGDASGHSLAGSVMYGLSPTAISEPSSLLLILTACSIAIMTGRHPSRKTRQFSNFTTEGIND